MIVTLPTMVTIVTIRTIIMIATIPTLANFITAYAMIPCHTGRWQEAYAEEHLQPHTYLQICWVKLESRRGVGAEEEMEDVRYGE